MEQDLALVLDHSAMVQFTDLEVLATASSPDLDLLAHMDLLVRLGSPMDLHSAAGLASLAHIALAPLSALDPSAFALQEEHQAVVLDPQVEAPASDREVELHSVALVWEEAPQALVPPSEERQELPRTAMEALGADLKAFSGVPHKASVCTAAIVASVALMVTVSATTPTV